MNRKQKLHAGAMVPATGRITFTQKKNGRFYLGLDAEAFGALLAIVREQEKSATGFTPDPRTPTAAVSRVRHAINSYVDKLEVPLA